MRRGSVIAACIILAATFAACQGREAEYSQAETFTPSSAVSLDAPPLLDCLYYERERFVAAVSAPPLYETGVTVRLGLIPHHLLASDMIAGFYAAARGDYEAVVILSPSHYPEEAGSEIVTASPGWATPFGELEADLDIVGELLSDKELDALDGPDTVEYDHGAAGHMPFIKKYFPKAKVAPVLIANSISGEKLIALEERLYDALENKNALIISSADCSHYLMPDEAAIRDKETAQAIEAFDYQAIARFGDSNIDSPPAAMLFLRFAERMKLTPKQLDHSSSVDKLNFAISNPAYADGITTYFVYSA